MKEKHVFYLPTYSFEQIMEWADRKKIVKLVAERGKENLSQKLTFDGLPYLGGRRWEGMNVYVNYKGKRQGFINPEKIMEVVEKNNLNDLAIQEICFIITSDDDNELIQRVKKISVADMKRYDAIVCKLERTNHGASNDVDGQVLKRLRETMGYKVEDETSIGFKWSTLDFVGVYTADDFASGIEKNLIDEIESKYLEKITESVVPNSDNRGDRFYREERVGTWVLVGDRRF